MMCALAMEKEDEVINARAATHKRNQTSWFLLMGLKRYYY
jgi:hypothetical protein